MLLWIEYQKFLKQSPTPISEIADMDVYELQNKKIYISKDRKLIKTTHKTMEGHGFEISMNNLNLFSFLFPKVVISKSPDIIRKYSFTNPVILSDEVGKPLFSIANKKI